MEEIVTIFGNGFFPVMMTGALFWYIVRSGDQHREEMDTMKKALEANTVALVELKEMLRREYEKE